MLISRLKRAFLLFPPFNLRTLVEYAILFKNAKHNDKNNELKTVDGCFLSSSSLFRMRKRMSRTAFNCVKIQDVVDE